MSRLERSAAKPEQVGLGTRPGWGPSPCLTWGLCGGPVQAHTPAYWDVRSVAHLLNHWGQSRLGHDRPQAT